jgi:ATP-binding protein involved in chromosome partitioning
MPPGTGDILLSLLNVIGRTSDGSIVVTLPTALSASVVRRILELLIATKIPLFGILENMSYITNENEKTKPLSSGIGNQLSTELGVKFLGELPIDYDAASTVDKSDIPGLLNTKFAIVLHNIMKESKLIK